MSVVYIVTNEARGITRYATTSQAEAVAWAQGRADAERAAQPHGASPHYVVTAWDGEAQGTEAHIYASRNGQPHPMSTVVFEAEALGTVVAGAIPEGAADILRDSITASGAGTRSSAQSMLAACLKSLTLYRDGGADVSALAALMVSICQRRGFESLAAQAGAL